MDKTKNKKESNSFKKGGNGAIIWTLIILILAIVLIISFEGVTNPVKQMELAIKNSDYEQIVELYNDEKDEETMEKFNTLLLAEAEKSLNDYNDGAMEHEITIKDLSTIKNTGLLEKELEKIIEKANLLKQSKNDFRDGKLLIEASLFVEGIKKLGKVVDFDTNYEKSQTLIRNNAEKRDLELFKEAAGRIVETDCSEAIDYLEENKNIDINGTIQAKINYYKNEHLKAVKEEVKKFIEDNDFVSAIEKLEENKIYLKEDIND